MSHGGDPSHHFLQLTSQKLNGKNYLEWAQSVKLAINGRGKLGYLTGDITQPKEGDSARQTWSSENSLVIASLINSMEPAIGKPYLFLPTAKDVWEAIQQTYSDAEDSSQVFELKNKLWKSKQEEREVTIYYSDMVSLWQELDQFYGDEWECTRDSVKIKKKEESDRVYLFLAGLNKVFDEARSRILSRKPLPSLREVFSEIRRDETRRNVMLKSNVKPFDDVETSALISKENELDSVGRKKPWCDKCRKFWHKEILAGKFMGNP